MRIVGGNWALRELDNTGLNNHWVDRKDRNNGKGYSGRGRWKHISPKGRVKETLDALGIKDWEKFATG